MAGGDKEREREGGAKRRAKRDGWRKQRARGEMWCTMDSKEIEERKLGRRVRESEREERWGRRELKGV